MKNILTINPLCRSDVKRSRKKITTIYLHSTGNTGDTARNNCYYFKDGRLTRYAGAHIFIDNKECVKSIPLNRKAYSVGKDSENEISVSIEMCDSLNGCNEKTFKQLIKAIKYVQKYCPNVKYIKRHYDASGKLCPVYYVDDKKWKSFKNKILKNVKGVQ